jgi:general secretion pathway protein D
MTRTIRILLIAIIASTLIGMVTPVPGLAQTEEAGPAEKKTPQTRNLPLNSKQLVSIDFNNVDIGVFIKFISDLTKKNFIINERVRGKVTIISPGKITVKEAYKVFESVLEVHGYAAVPSGEVIKIVPTPDARSKNIKTRLKEEAGAPGDEVVTQIIPLRYADPNEIKRLFTPLVSKSSVILAYSPTNTLIITDIHSNIKRLLRILKSIDITGVGQQIAVIPVEHADATKLVTLLGSIFKAGKRTKGAAKKDITFVADERTNVIVVLASEGDTENIRRLVKTLDKETPKGQAKIHVYYLEHALAEDLAGVLKDIPKEKGAAKQPGKKTAPVVSDKVRISADKATNSLIIMADSADYMTLEQIIKKIDIPRAMVYIEALIMEVNVDKDFRIGSDYLLGGDDEYEGKDILYGGGFSAGGFGGDPGTSGTLANIPGQDALGVPIPPGLSLGIFGEAIEISGFKFPSISAIFQAYKKDGDVRILSTPQILTTDNQEAKIYVGQNVPFQTKSTTTENDTFNSFEYRDVGRTLKITPSISIDRMVRLEISLESTDLLSATDFRPTTLKRTVDTTAIVKDRNTVVLGGLIDNKVSSTVYKIPCLGDIPGLGYLFSNRSKVDTKTNLYVFLTPKVIKNSTEAHKIYKNKRDQIEGMQEENIKLYRRREPGVEFPETDENDNRIESFNYRENSSSDDATMENSSTVQPVPQPETVATPPDQSDDTIAPQSPAADSNPDPPPAPLEPEKSTEPRPQGAANPAPIDTAAQVQTASASRTNQTNAQQPTATSVTPAGKGYTVQVVSVESAARANNILKQLTSRGYAAYTVQSQVNGKPWYRLRIGYYDRRDKAQDLMTRLQADNYDPILIQF